MTRPYTTTSLAKHWNITTRRILAKRERLESLGLDIGECIDGQWFFNENEARMIRSRPDRLPPGTRGRPRNKPQSLKKSARNSPGG